MNIATKNQIIIIGAICSRVRIDAEQKAAMVAGFSNGRCTSSKGLYQEEADAMIKYLQQQYPAGPDKREKMRRNILAMAHEMGWKLDNGKADMDRINLWCQKFGKKNLNQYSYGELPKLVYAFKQVYHHFLNHL